MHDLYVALFASSKAHHNMNKIFHATYICSYVNPINFRNRLNHIVLPHNCPTIKSLQ